MKDLHVVCKKITRNGPERVIFEVYYDFLRYRRYMNFTSINHFKNVKVETYLATVSASVFISSTEEIILVNNFFSFGCFEPILASFGRNHLNCNFLKHWRCRCYTMFCSAPAYNISVFSDKILFISLEIKFWLKI